jgi:cytochrome c oxidase subunit 1
MMIAAVSIIKVIIFDRPKELKLNQMSLFTWSILFTMIMLISSAPSLMVGLGMMFYDYFNPIFFVASSHDVLLFTILFWFWGHPIVYIAIMPFFGLIYEIIPKFTDTPIYSYSSGVWGLGILMVLSELVWGHHLLNSGLGVLWVEFFTTASFLVVIPSAITIFNYIATLWTAKKIRMTVPMLFTINGIVDFIIGGITGVMQSAGPFNEQVHGTYWVTGHFHFIFIGITMGIMFASFYILFPTFSGGRKYNVGLAKWHFALTAFGSYLMAFSWSVGGFLGMPRAVAGYFGFFQGYQDSSIIGGVIIGIGQLIFLYNIAVSWWKAPQASQDNIFEEGDTGSNRLPAGMGGK